MRVAVPASGKTLESPIDPRFGRSPYYLIVDTETMKHEILPNTRMSAPRGIEAARLVAGEGVDVVLAGALGPNSTDVLSQAGIKIVKGVRGTVKEAVEAFKNGELWK
ncbi:dinitrogenase iron-molybdenum cofactor biosynthesis protein [Candidatus Bathyarchaeota archaeon]|nr:dinitrogenase iron-molybdenum cofactor biosynthesis protein [Candidatus Bathyarchaeota archaeon]